MTDAMEVLYAHAQDWLVLPLLTAEPEYDVTMRAADSREQRLRAMLSGEGATLLDELMDERSLLSALREQAMFRAGFQIALELGRS